MATTVEQEVDAAVEEIGELLKGCSPEERRFLRWAFDRMFEGADEAEILAMAGPPEGQG